MTDQPPEGRCTRCHQTRPLFHYKPLHNCIEDAGLMRLDEAAEWIAEIESNGDRWCEARLERRVRRMCVPCHDREAADEQRHIKENQL